MKLFSMVYTLTNSNELEIGIREKEIANVDDWTLYLFYAFKTRGQGSDDLELCPSLFKNMNCPSGLKESACQPAWQASKATKQAFKSVRHTTIAMGSRFFYQANSYPQGREGLPHPPSSTQIFVSTFLVYTQTLGLYSMVCDVL